MERLRRRTLSRLSEDPELRRASASAVGSASAGYELDMKLREFEISQLTQRNNFFMIFQGVMVSGLVQSEGAAAPLINFSVCFMGALVSIFQIGMAGGAKYWQSRWESAARSSEIAIVLGLLAAGKHTIRTFTHDLSLLSDEERAGIDKWVKNHPSPEDAVGDLKGFIHDRVIADTAGESKRPIRYRLDWWVRKWGITPKWSVSRIPLWIGAVMFFFWSTLWLHTWRIPVVADFSICECKWISFAPLNQNSTPQQNQNTPKVKLKDFAG